MSQGSEHQSRPREDDREPQYAAATTDAGFKHMLTSEDTSILTSLLNTLVPSFRLENISDVKICSGATPVITRRGLRQRSMGVYGVASNGTHCVIEMQNRRHGNFDERSFYYACGTFTRQLSETDHASAG